MELVNKVLQANVDNELMDIAPATRSDNVYLSSDPTQTIDATLQLAASAVQSVNGKTGAAVELTATDVGAPEAAWSNLKTYTSVTQLSLTTGSVTTAQVFDAMPNKSAAMLVDSDVSDAPNTGCIILIYRYSAPRGRAVAYTARSTTDYVMLTRSGDPAYGLTGEWVQI